MTWQLRRAGVDDLDALMELESTIFANDAWSTGTMRQELQNPHCFYVLGFRPETPEQIDAYAGLLSPQGAKEADIQTIAVAVRARRSGLGRTLVLTLMNEARHRGARELFLEVRADNHGAQALYASLGFEQLAIREKYYQPDGVDAIVMRAEVAPRRTTFTAPRIDSPAAPNQNGPGQP